MLGTAPISEARGRERLGAAVGQRLGRDVEHRVHLGGAGAEAGARRRGPRPGLEAEGRAVGGPSNQYFVK